VIDRGARAYWLASIQKPQSQLILSIVGFNVNSVEKVGIFRKCRPGILNDCIGFLKVDGEFSIFSG